MAATNSGNVDGNGGQDARGQDQVLVLLDEIARSNNDLTTEIRALREELKKKEDEGRKAYANLEKKLVEVTNSLSPPSENRSRRKRQQTVRVPAPCRRVTKQIYKTLCRREDFSRLKTTESIHSTDNKACVEAVITEVHRQYNGEDKTPWCRLQIQSVLSRYLTSLYEKEKQTREGKYQAHKEKCRRTTRKRNKLTRRTLALEKVNWVKKKLAKVADVLSEDAMSSEESSYEENENGNPKVTGYIVKRFSWESDRFKKAKTDLDKAYKKHLTERAKNRILPRTNSANPSTRAAREDFPKWAVA